MDLRLQVTRDQDNRLRGTITGANGEVAHPFSGTLELMRVFEELVPVERGATDPPPGAAPPTV